MPIGLLLCRKPASVESWPRCYAPHPGRILPSRSEIKYCAKQLDFSPKTLRALIKGSIDVTKELAVLLGSVWPWHSAAF